MEVRGGCLHCRVRSHWVLLHQQQGPGRRGRTREQVQGVVTVRGAVNERTAGTEMIAIARYLESANVVTALEFYFPREVVQDGHWKGATRVLFGQITTQEWAELIEELHKASGTLMLE